VDLDDGLGCPRGRCLPAPKQQIESPRGLFSARRKYDSPESGPIAPFRKVMGRTIEENLEIGKAGRFLDNGNTIHSGLHGR
jgi:hypothetical protein